MEPSCWTSIQLALECLVAQYDFFQQAMQGREFISGVTISSITGKPAIFHSVPIRNAANTVVGVLRARSSLYDRDGHRPGRRPTAWDTTPTALCWTPTAW